MEVIHIKIPGGFLTAEQLTRLADAADKFDNGSFIFTRSTTTSYQRVTNKPSRYFRMASQNGISLSSAKSSGLNTSFSTFLKESFNGSMPKALYHENVLYSVAIQHVTYRRYNIAGQYGFRPYDRGLANTQSLVS